MGGTLYLDLPPSTSSPLLFNSLSSASLHSSLTHVAFLWQSQYCPLVPARGKPPMIFHQSHTHLTNTHRLRTLKGERIEVPVGANFTLPSFTSVSPYLLGQQIPPPSTRMQANSQVKRQLASLFEAPSKRQKRNHLIEALDKTLDEVSISIDFR